ncbi:MAG: 23S rRNA pseudouridine(1911/1915/1917) synthase RluD [Neisseriaceae bacterium]|nr:23S rRNA pseudouridine(1911/1915/1917) synthase RluD [Neisseriaceae bacterium]MBR5674853.1 23S rRNA pseudouridine(1911/1915/1917) synthase RluD [Neisseriaceae bacterium]
MMNVSDFESEDYSEVSSLADEIELIVDNQYAGLRLDACLAKMLPEYSRSRITDCIKKGFVSIDDKVASPKTKVVGGEKIIFRLPEKVETANFAPENIPLNIIYEDDAILVIDKPANLVVHPAAGNWSGTLLNGLLHYCPALQTVPRAGIVHRLDKDTTGLMVVAKTVPAQTDLIRQLQERTVKRIYRAIANGVVPYDGKIETQIGRNPHNRLKMAVVPFGGKLAVTHVTVLERFATHSYIECALETGRTHQIRVHLREAKHPLAGDPLYGNPRHACDEAVKAAVQALNRQALHARELRLIHPVSGEEMSFKSELPADFKAVLAALRGEYIMEKPFSGSLKNDFDEDFDDDWDDDDDNGVEVVYVRE